MILTALLLAACAAPVIRKDLLEQGTRNVSLSWLAANPAVSRGKLFILGGIIAKTTVTAEGTVIEALYVPVDKKGRLEKAPGRGRYFAIWPKANGILDPMIYKKGRLITVAGTFEGIRQGKLDKAVYNFPTFEIVQIFIWKEETSYYPYFYYSPYYYGPYYPYPYYDYPYYYPYFGFEFGQGLGEQEENERPLRVLPGRGGGGRVVSPR